MDFLKGKKIIRTIAENNEKSEAAAYREIRKRIDEIWDSEDWESYLLQSALFPEGKPAPEEFVEKMSGYLIRENRLDGGR